MNIPIIILIFLPFIGSVFTFIVGKIYKKSAFICAYIISIILFSLTVYICISFTQALSFDLEWFSFGNITLPFGIYIDELSLVMLLIATGLGALDIHFSHDYMADERDQARYYSKVLFFIGGMILLVSAKEMLGLFVGWEFMGLASYLLISFWHQNSSPADAGVSAFLYTKFGDIFLFASLGIIFYTTGTLDMIKLNELSSSGEINSQVAYVVSIFIFIAAIGKSGQFPLFPWLMRAMEGPTTVSALIHGATMVNSGIYIVARMFDFYVAAEALVVVAAVASLSAFIGATSALVQNEMKKVLAYSTMSHLSLAFIGLGAGSLAAGMTHLINHAIFKALLFLGAGAVILSAHHVKDLWRLGGLKNRLILVSIFMGMGVLSLSGIPIFSGFYSKDAIIASTLLNPETHGLISTLTIIAALLSIAYAGRLWTLIFVGKPRDEELHVSIKAPSKFWISLPLGVMATLTLALGVFQKELAEFITAEKYHELHVNGLFTFMMGVILVLGLIIYYFYVRRTDLRDKISAQPLMKSIHQILFNGYYIEMMINWFAKSIIVNAVAKSINWVEKNIVDAFINGVVTVTHLSFTFLKHTHSAKVSNQSGAMMLGLMMIVATVLIRSFL